ncbi:MAG: nitroreductase family deazaflavin-dependent oxidoreductase [Gammaproteobacteria bacterium]|nr:nitroreductase family deazaflavin-dependent oxidoreductase [Gammaproteobacteria bacterium]
MQDGETWYVVGSLAGYDTHPARHSMSRANPQCCPKLDRRKMSATARDATDAERKAQKPVD